MRLAIVPFVLLLAAFGVACGDGDDASPDSDVTQTDAVTAEPDPEPDPEADPEPSDGTVVPPPPGSVQINVTLQEWSVGATPGSVRPGLVYFRVDNLGPDDPHEFVVIRTSDGAANLPVEEGRVPEDAVDFVGEIEPFAPGSRAAIAFDLEAGAYALICNVAEVEEGELESHYQLGMHTDFIVE